MKPGAVWMRAVAVLAAAVAAAGLMVAGTAPAALAATAIAPWGPAQRVPGSAALNSGGPAGVNSVSCPATGGCVAGNCAASGSYQDASGHQQAYVVNETGGTWGTAIEVPGSAALNAFGRASVVSISCPKSSPRSCAAIGNYGDATGHSQSFLVSEANGTWGTAIPVPGVTQAIGSTVSCAAAGSCVAAGSAGATAASREAFTVTESGGTWGSAQQVPGLDAMAGGSPSQVHSIACSSAGNCVLAGDYQDSRFFEQAFLVNEIGRTWRTAQAVPGLIALNTSIAQTQAASCVRGGTCTAAGIYSGQAGSFHIWVIAQAAA